MNKYTFISGASRGIGLAAARLFAENGYTVYAGFLNTFAPLQALAREFDGQIIPLRGDVRLLADVEQMFLQMPAIDVLVNNAGTAGFMPFSDMSEDDWDRMIDANLKPAFLCCKLSLPKMLACKGGSIVNISSVWGVTGGSCEVHYSAAKAGIIGFTKALAKELGPSNIRVNAVAPGVVDTDMIADLSQDDLAALREQTALGTIATPRQIASAILNIAENPFITGEVLNINGGFHI